MQFLSAWAARSRQGARRLVIRAALALAGALAAMVAIAFATGALFEAWRLQYGVVGASVGLSVVYLVLAAICLLSLRLVGAGRPATLIAEPSPGSPADAATLKSPPQTRGASEAAALAIGVEIARQLTPLQLAIVAAISGFVAGRRL